MEAVLDALAAGTTVVTASRRLARRLAEAYAERQNREQRECWPSPDVLPWNGWIRSGWRTSSEARLLAGQIDEPILLDPAQARALWQSIIAEDEVAAAHLLNLPATAARVAEAWELLQQWRIGSETLARYATPELDLLQRWSRRYLQTCRTRNWLDPARLPDVLAERVAADGLDVPARVLLVGFDELTPQQRAYLTALQSRGCDWQWLEIAAAPASALRVSLGDSHDEFETAARWARGLLEQGGSQPPRIGLLVADLAAEKATLESILTAVFCPGQGPEQLASWVNFSYGRRLREWPPVQAALSLLRLLVHRRLPAADAGELLRSPFLLAAEDEHEQRVAADLLLRRPGATRPGLEAVLQACERAESRQLHRALLAVAEQAWSGRQSPHDWARTFARALAACGWPGQRALDSAEYQCVQAWHGLFDQLSDLGVVEHRLGAADALARLAELAADTVFQPQSQGQPPVQVLGLLEATGERFDQLWLTGLTDISWPAAPKPNPFLPQNLQASHGMPHASAARELRFARNLLQRLRGNTRHLIVSHARRRGDEALRPSPLIAELPECSREALALSTSSVYAVQIQATSRLESMRDEVAEPLAAERHDQGGVALFQDQIACPYRAFARHRLLADAPETVGDGLDARVRGLLLHDVMDKVWQDLRDAAGLARRETAQWQARLAQLVEACLRDAARRYPGLLDGRLARIEHARLCARVNQWLALEAERPDFEVVALEQRQALQVGPLHLRVRLDRVDRQNQSERVIIDYKSGRCAVADLLDPRPREPQLPLYAAFTEPPPVAVALASLRVGEPGFKGVGAETGAIAGVVAPDPDKHGYDWPGLLAQWREQLTAVAESFAAGDAAVAPREPDSCRYCDLPILCRIGLTDVDDAGAVDD